VTTLVERVALQPRWRIWVAVAVVIGLAATGVVLGVVLGGGAAPEPDDPVVTEPDRDPLPFETSLLADRTGFGASVEGGFLGEVVQVTSDADAGPGSLREAVAGDEPKWVQFDADMTITLESPISVGSNTTVDGRGRVVTITGPGVAGLHIEEATEVILTNLTLRGFGDPGGTASNDPDDAVLITASERVWIDHLDLSDAADKLIGVSAGSRDITISWNHFHDQEQVVQIGNQATREAGEQTVTLHHNYFDRTGYRNPVASYARVHVYNNVFEDWRLYAVRSEREAEVALERNVFLAGRNTRATSVRPGGDGCNDDQTRCDDSPGWLRAVDNLTLGGAVIEESSPEVVFDPSQEYEYVADPALPALVDEVRDGAGPR
jgi:pectate lyase